MSSETGFSLREWKERQRFDPAWMGFLVNPFYFARRGLMDGLKEFFPQLTGELLDVGCGRKPYRAFISCARYVGMEVDTPLARTSFSADVFYDGRRFPFPDQSFDAVLCSQVFEHVFTPQEFLAEISRVLRPGGVALFTVPFVWDEHEQPHDFARYSSFGLRAVMEAAGLSVEAQRKTMADSRAWFQLINAYFYKITRSESRLLNWAAQLGLMAPVSLVGMLVGRILPTNEDLYLDNIVLVRKPVRGQRA